MSVIEILQQLSDFNAEAGKKLQSAVSRLMRLDKGSFWAHCCGTFVGSLPSQAVVSFFGAGFPISIGGMPGGTAHE